VFINEMNQVYGCITGQLLPWQSANGHSQVGDCLLPKEICPTILQNHLAYVWVIIFFYYYISLFFKNMFKLFFRIQILLRLYLIFSTFVLNFLNHSNVILKNKFS